MTVEELLETKQSMDLTKEEQFSLALQVRKQQLEQLDAIIQEQNENTPVESAMDSGHDEHYITIQGPRESRFDASTFHRTWTESTKDNIDGSQFNTEDIDAYIQQHQDFFDLIQEESKQPLYARHSFFDKNSPENIEWLARQSQRDVGLLNESDDSSLIEKDALKMVQDSYTKQVISKDYVPQWYLRQIDCSNRANHMWDLINQASYSHFLLNLRPIPVSEVLLMTKKERKQAKAYALRNGNIVLLRLLCNNFKDTSIEPFDFEMVPWAQILEHRNQDCFVVQPDLETLFLEFFIETIGIQDVLTRLQDIRRAGGRSNVNQEVLYFFATALLLYALEEDIQFSEEQYAFWTGFQHLDPERGSDRQKELMRVMKMYHNKYNAQTEEEQPEEQKELVIEAGIADPLDDLAEEFQMLGIDINDFDREINFRWIDVLEPQNQPEPNIDDLD